MKKFTFTIVALLIIFVGNLYSQTWEEVSSSTSFILYGMSFPPEQNDIGYAAGMQYTSSSPGVIVKTEDGGQTWSTILPVMGEIDGLETICFTSATTGYAGGWNGYFIKTTNGGASWSALTVGSNIWYYNCIVFWDENHGLVSARNNDGLTEVYVTDDAGANWTTVTGFDQIIFEIAYASADVLFATGNAGLIIKSSDGGLNWSSVYQAVGLTFGVSFANENFGVVGGEDGKIFSTTDGGTTWNDDFATGYENFWAVKAFTGDSAYVGGTDENIYKTTNGGQTWSMEYNGTGSSTLYQIAKTPDNTVLACGSQGKMLRRTAPVIQLVADFTASPTELCAGGEVEFTDLSTGGATSWYWEFDGGTPETSTEQNPAVVYASEGNFDVSLTVSDGVNEMTEIKTDYISVLALPTPEIIGDDLVCINQVSVYSIPENIGNTYEWEAIGGLISEGEGTSEISVTWGDTPGMGYVIVSESLELGCLAVDTMTVTIDECTGIEDNLSDNKVSLYPNPVQSTLSLEYSAPEGETVTISVFSSMGQLVMQQKEIAQGQKQTSLLSVGNLAKGIYVVSIKTSKNYLWKGKFNRN